MIPATLNLFTAVGDEVVAFLTITFFSTFAVHVASGDATVFNILRNFSLTCSFSMDFVCLSDFSSTFFLPLNLPSRKTGPAF